MDHLNNTTEVTEVEKKPEIETEWYVVNTYAGHENKVKENLYRRVETMNLHDCLFKIVVAEVTEEAIKKNKVVEVVTNLFPGYLFVQMKMTDEAWYIVRNTPGVTGFIGSSGGGAKPFPVSKEEIDGILNRLNMKENAIHLDFVVGDHVKILVGPFKGIEAKVESLDDTHKVATVIAMVFGRETPVEIGYTDIESVAY